VTTSAWRRAVRVAFVLGIGLAGAAEDFDKVIALLEKAEQERNR
jgi:sRNA-binding regulator protein Hfq